MTDRTSPARCTSWPRRLERGDQALRILRADLGRGTVLAAEHLLERALRAELAAGDDDDVVDRLRDLGQHVAGDEDGGAASGLLAQQAAQPADARRVQPVGRLVEDQHVGSPSSAAAMARRWRMPSE